MEASAVQYRPALPSACRTAADGPVSEPLLFGEPPDAARDPAQLPPGIAARLLPLVHVCCGLGFHAPWFAVRESDFALHPEACALMRHGSGNAAARITCGQRGQTTLSFLTRGESGDTTAAFQTTGGSGPGCAGCPSLPGACRAGGLWIDAVRVERATPERLWELHGQRIALGKVMPEPLADDREMIAFCDAAEGALFQWQRETGKLVPLDCHEAALLRERVRARRAYTARLRVARAAAPEALAVLRSLGRPQASYPGWKAFCAFLLVAAGLVGLGIASPFDPGFLGMAGGAFLLNALGSRAAQWICGEAGSAGQRAGIEAVVLLSGAVPGLAVGSVLAVFGVDGSPPMASPMGILSLLLVVSNFLLLLPVPFSYGGRLLDLLLLSRHEMLKPALAVFCGCALGLTAWHLSPPLPLAAVLWGGALWIGLWPWLAPGDPWLACRLRRAFRGQKADSPETVAAVVRAIKRKHPRRRDPWRIARSAEAVCRIMNAAPPRPRAACGLLAAYAVALLLPAAPLVAFLQKSPVLEEWAKIAPAPVRETTVLVGIETPAQNGEDKDEWREEAPTDLPEPIDIMQGNEEAPTL